MAPSEIVSKNGAGLVRVPTLCLCKRRHRSGLAARMLLVHRGSAELTGNAPARLGQRERCVSRLAGH